MGDLGGERKILQHFSILLLTDRRRSQLVLLTMSNSVQNPDFVLIVDDNPTNLSVLSQALKTAGLSVRTAEDGESAIDLIARRLPALILLDVQMPGISGFEVCQKLKADPKTQAIPIIFMTALADTDSKIKGLSLGAVDYIPKPFEQAEAIARVRVHLRLKQLTDQTEQLLAERTLALAETQLQMVQQEKLSMLGQLLAGVAHEINNPIGCIASNINPAHEHVAELAQILRLCQQHPQLPAEIRGAIDEVDLDFVLEDLPNLLKSMKVSIGRIKDISISLRNFVRTDSVMPIAADLHEGLDSTLLILNHRVKASGKRPEIKINRQYGDLGMINCYPGQMNQVFMNIMANGIDALEDAWEQGLLSDRTPAITVTTARFPQTVEIRIADNGAGMTEAVKAQIFDALFTTKEMGRGTGLGLAIVHQIMTEKHKGAIVVNTTPGEGTEFVMTIPA
jgi:signal transduction histidine kinase